MRSFRDFPIRRKLLLVIMLVSSLGLLLAGTAIVVYERNTFQQRETENLASLAQIIGAQSTAALDFDDAEVAQKNLAALKARPDIAAAGIYEADGKLFTQYLRSDLKSVTLPARAEAEGERIQGDYLNVFRAIKERGKTVGTVCLRYDMQGVRTHLMNYIGIVGTVIVGLLMLTLVLSSGFQRFISNPIVELAGVAHAVSEDKDYSVRAVKTGQDEIGELIDTFNAMLSQIQERDIELRALNDTLEQRVQQRTEELSGANIELETEINERLRVEEAMRGVQTFLTSIVENIPNMIFVKDAEQLRFVSLNKAEEDLIGIPRKHMIGKNDGDLFPAEEAAFFTAADRSVLESGKLLDIPEEPVQTEHGVRILHTKKMPIYDATGKPQYLLGISEDITERKQSEEALARQAQELARSNVELHLAKDAAEAASRAKSEFLANMSHELRTPLNAIIGFSEILEDQTFGELNPRQGKYISNVLTSGRHLLQLINDILDLSKVEAGKMELDYVTFPVSSALQDVVNIVKTLAAKKNIELKVEVAPDCPPATADAPKFKQIMYNLLSNAIKFTPNGGVVTVTALSGTVAPDASNGQAIVPVCIAVSDTGVGIKAEDQERIFAEFEQVDSSYSRQQQGTGLGLALTRRLVEMHGGRIWVESQGVEGKGSTFFFVLPGGPSALLAAEPSQNAPEATSESPNGTPENGVAPLTVLVVEDNLPASDLLAHYLTESGYRVERAFDGEQALQRVRELHFDAVTLDIMLPNKDGWQVLAELKAAPATADVPVVIVSITDDQQLGFSLGAVDFLVKPIQKERLLDAVRKAITPHGEEAGTILIVDDEAQTVEMLSDILRQQGYKILQALSGEDGVALAEEHLPDAIILDLMMPGLTGFDVVQRLREHPAAREIPILIFSAKDITDEDRARLNSHIRAIVPKSGKEDLLRELERLKKMAQR